MHLLQKNVEAWKDFQSAAKAQTSAPTATHSKHQPTTSAQPIPASTETQDTSRANSSQEEKRKRKRKTQPDDEIDALFEGTLGKKIKKGDLAKPEETSKSKFKQDKHSKITDKSLLDVLGAIRAAPKDDKGPRKKRAR